VHHQYQRHRWQFATGTTGVVDTGGKFGTGVKQYSTVGKFDVGVIKITTDINDTGGNFVSE
jgi:hypothetical protein